MSRTRKIDPDSMEALRDRLRNYAQELLLGSFISLIEGDQAEEMLDQHLEAMAEESEDHLDIIVPAVTEFQLYAVVVEDDATQARLNTLILRDAIPSPIRTRLAALSTDSGGWYHRRHGETHFGFTQLQQWLPIYREWYLRRLAEEAMESSPAGLTKSQN